MNVNDAQLAHNHNVITIEQVTTPQNVGLTDAAAALANNTVAPGTKYNYDCAFEQ